eukprot:scaffold64732_cov44-Cyclotella_meneghiniana.AAC.2
MIWWRWHGAAGHKAAGTMWMHAVVVEGEGVLCWRHLISKGSGGGELKFYGSQLISSSSLHTS